MRLTDRIAERLVGEHRQPVPAGRSDYDLNPEFGRPDDVPLKPAAVLVPLVDRPQGVTVLLTKRTEHLNSHAGQIAFPGGLMEPYDATPEAAALRETHEETGIASHFVRMIGRLSTYETVTGYAVTPCVGVVQPDFDLVPDDFEVAEIFEVPLEFLMDSDNHQRHSGWRNGRRRHWYAMPYGDYYIWGATAGMLVDLSRKVGDLW